MTEAVLKSRGAPAAPVIKSYWEGAETPSQRSIEKIMREDGWDVSASTIIRCVNRGFAPAKPCRSRPVKTSPEINAVRQVKSMAPDDAAPEMLAAALVERLQNIPDGEKDRIKELLDMSEQDIIDNTRKLYRVAGYLLAEDLAKSTKMMMLAPDKAAKLFQALGSGFELSSSPPPMPPSTGDDAKIINHDPAEIALSPSAKAIRDFRAKRASAAA